MSVESKVRPGAVGYWDRFVGPGQSKVEAAGTVAAIAAGALGGDVALEHGTPGGRRALVRLAASDLWGGVWVNNTPSCVAWYERPGQGPRQHLKFAALHLLHPGLIAAVDHAGGRNGGSSVGWALAHYGWMMGSTAVVGNVPRPARLAVALVTGAVGLALDRRLGRSNAAPWFAQTYYTKLLVGHAAGSVWNIRGRRP